MYRIACGVVEFIQNNKFSMGSHHFYRIGCGISVLKLFKNITVPHIFLSLYICPKVIQKIPRYRQVWCIYNSDYVHVL